MQILIVGSIFPIISYHKAMLESHDRKVSWFIALLSILLSFIPLVGMIIFFIVLGNKIENNLTFGLEEMSEDDCSHNTTYTKIAEGPIYSRYEILDL